MVALLRKPSEYHRVGRIATLHLIPARFVGCRGAEIEQRLHHFGGEDLFGKLWLLPWCPGTGGHYSPVADRDRC
jgi:hypothetical protein